MKGPPGRGRWASAARHGVAVLTAAVWGYPYFFMVSTSLKTLPEILRHPTALWPERVDLAAYREVFSSISVGRSMAVTVAVAVTIAALQVGLALPAGYALAKLRFAGRGFVFALVVACLLIPAQVTFIAVFLMFARVRLVDTLASLVLPFAASAFGTFLVRQALLSIPDEVIEAARMDGASEWTLVYRILAPMIRPTLVSLVLVSFVFHYNDYFWPLVMTTSDDVRTLPLGVALLREQGTGVRWHIVMAGNVVLTAPVLLLFAFAQKHLVRVAGARE